MTAIAMLDSGSLGVGFEVYACIVMLREQKWAAEIAFDGLAGVGCVRREAGAGECSSKLAPLGGQEIVIAAY